VKVKRPDRSAPTASYVSSAALKTSPRPPIATPPGRLAAGTVAVFGAPPENRPSAVTVRGAVRPEDWPRFRETGRELARLGVPEVCWDGGPVNPFAIQKVIDDNATVGRGKVRFPLYDPDPAFKAWRDTHSEIEHHRANCPVQERWVMRAMSIGAPEQREALLHLRAAADFNLQHEDRQHATTSSGGVVRRDQRRDEEAHHLAEWERMHAAGERWKKRAAKRISAACKVANKTECSERTVYDHLTRRR